MNFTHEHKYFKRKNKCKSSEKETIMKEDGKPFTNHPDLDRSLSPIYNI